MSHSFSQPTHVAKTKPLFPFRPLYPTYELPGSLSTRHRPVCGHNGPPQEACDLICQARHNLWLRTGFVLSSLKVRPTKDLFFKPDTLQAWKDERADPTIPPPSNIVHVIKHMEAAPELHSDWEPDHFLR